MIGVLATQQQELAGKYRPYPEYKDSGITRLGAIPSHWQPKKLKRMASIENGRDYKHVEATEGFPVIGSGGQFTWSEQYLYSGESVLLGRKGTVDKPLYINGSFWTVDTMFYTKVGKTIPAKFLYYAALTIEFGLYSTNTALPSMTQEDLGNIHFGSPSYGEAENIAAFLDYETSRIDRLIAQQQRLIELLKEKRQAVISHAVTKGLNPNAPMKDSGVEWLGQVPKHWIVAGFKKYIEPIVDYRGKTPTKTESGVFLVTARNIKNGSIDYHLSEEFISEDDYEEVMRRGKPKLGDVLFTTEAPLGEVAQVDNESIALAQRIIKFRGLRDILDCSYLKLFIQSTEFQHGLMTFATGSTALGIKSDRLGYLKQLVPPISEQTQIVEVVAKHAMQFGKLIDIANKAIQLMQERRTALISAAVTGKIDLRGWTQPAEEVAA
ncbi:restriction endonuclease subunit S [Aeromonas veronii]|uniref:restriction endonuclease subunit S n=1 Tax=Aeromonas veronii TaxID=654 RepID=UPI003D230363